MAAPIIWAQNDLWKLFDLSLLRSSGLEAYLESTLDHCATCFSASAGSIFLREGSTYVVRATVGTSAPPKEASFRHGKGIAGIVAASGEARLIVNPTDQPDLSKIETDESIGSSLVLPLIDQSGKAIGVLNLSRPSASDVFSKAELRQAELVAGQIAMAVSNARLVSNLTNSLEDARKAKDTLQAIFKSLPGSILIFSADGTLNVAASRVESECEFLIEPDHAMFDALTGCREKAKALDSPAEQHYHDLETDQFWHIQAVPLSGGGAIVTLNETTTRERDARDTARMRRLAEIGQMTAQIAHEIRNPLTGIRSAAQMIRQHPDVLSEFIGTIEEEAVRLNALCDEFLEFARPATIAPEESSLSKVIGEVLKIHAPLFKECGLTLESQLENGGSIWIDPRKVGQVAHNLIRNAMEASKPGDTVKVSVGLDWFRVEDAGQGMDEETVSNLFSPFFTTKSNGNGLGLCAARKIIEAHGGEISVNSSPNSGTTFMIRLPSNRQLSDGDE
ncbi:ATP-binding protein [Kamptonema cortianum]|nr:ATP-binding protein [Geitlerinema splendidum]MDK3156043.1 ATP-binding protein [Kamptonema cortianum]